MSDPIKLSIYCYLFNARVRSFDLDGAVANFLSFADEVVIATLAKQEDDTLERLRAYEASSAGRLKVMVSEMDISRNNRFDGDLKTAALQACTHPIRVIADCDERFIPSQRPVWDQLGQQLLTHPILDGWLLPVVDLYGSPDHIRSGVQLGVKMRMHKDTVKRRGVPPFAERGGGLFDTSRSDSTEPLLAAGGLATFTHAFPTHLLHPSICHMLPGYVLHYGFVDLQRRAQLGKAFWKEHWEKRSGREENVATTVGQLMNDVELVKHKLKLS